MPLPSRTYRQFLFCAGLAAILVLGACGGGDDDTDADLNPTTVPTRSTTSDTDSDGDGDDGDSDSTTIPTRPVSSGDEGDDDGDDGGSATSDIDACSLLGLDSVNVSLDTTTDGGVRDDFGEFAVCRWTDTRSSDFIQVDVVKADHDTIQALFDANDGEEIDAGVGDAAKWNSLTSSLEIIHGDYDVTIQVIDTGDDQAARQGNAEALAFRVLAALP